ncbi:alpha/beta fold hydrolase [Photobacterium sp. ZSDE20]|uniref:Alpha/beta fold hydrolase n=1 Tax=Photobacterium pectinilyticum TaxID=2906793 RepID=A0ABT1N8L5_9GAMM|nr:alpha/beta fold hydrolase [Photobacterium sp. ZSDE20]MCQ1061098.1 alpha/beta fold hydrolase [Photobacterium sp. ZSDE20]MDD1829216.1 alpha/beta fold hydrolase [Photobacterium sp. ZSDE20]
MKAQLKVVNAKPAKAIEAWFANFSNHDNVDYRLICFPFSGGGANIYRQWPAHLSQAEVWALKLPGREVRFSEPVITDLELLVETLAPIVKALMDKPCVFFGHSMGALIAFELARYMEKQYGCTPELLIVSGFRSPERKSKKRQLHALPESELVSELREYGGTVPQILEHRETMLLLLPMLRGDFKIHETHYFDPSQSVSCPIRALYGRADDVADRDDIEGWQKYTQGAFAITAFDGEHFFLNTEYPRICSLIETQMGSLTSGRRRFSA